MKKESKYEFINLPPEFKHKDTRPVILKQIIRIDYPKAEQTILVGKFTLDQATALEQLKRSRIPFGHNKRKGQYSWTQLLKGFDYQ